MNRPRIMVIAGFHGSGKTTAIIKMGQKFQSEMGKRVAIIVNEKTDASVDGMAARALGFEAAEVVGGCICVRVQDFIQSLNSIFAKLSPDIVFVEPIGISLPSRIQATIRDKFAGVIELAPITVLLDGRRIYELYEKQGSVGLGLYASYLFQQISDAEVLAVNKVDLIPSDNLWEVTLPIRKIKPDSELLMVSAKTGMGLDHLSEIILNETSKTIPLPTKDALEKQAEATADITWTTRRYDVTFDRQLDMQDVKDFIREVLREVGRAIIHKGEIIHVKLYFETRRGSLKASLVSLTQDVEFLGSIDVTTEKGVMTFNVIVRHLSEEAVKASLDKALPKTALTCQAKFRSWDLISLK